MQKQAFFFRILNSSVKQQGNNDKKVAVKNILQNFYFFSKLSLRLLLLFIVIFLGYLLYRSYSSIIFKENIETSENNNLINSINLNSSKIETIESLLNENKSKLSDIITELKTSKKDKSNLVLKDIKSDFEEIKHSK